MASELDIPEEVIAAFGLFGSIFESVPTGLINRTYFVEKPTGEREVLQRISPIFAPEIHENIQVVTAHVSKKGLRSPAIIPARNGDLFVEHHGYRWRAITFIDGRCLERFSNEEQARSAGALLGRFHHALRDLDHTFVGKRLGVHDTAAHIAALRAAEAAGHAHRRSKELVPLAEEILALAQELPTLPSIPERPVHGDPKASNILFHLDRDEAIALIDLDTVTTMSINLELGDAFRSWCNPLGENVERATFAIPIFESALRGYAEGASGLLSREEILSIVPSTLTIILELAARFARDALEEKYFGWDQSGFESASHHNELRARGQLSLARDLRAHISELQTLVDETF